MHEILSLYDSNCIGIPQTQMHPTIIIIIIITHSFITKMINPTPVIVNQDLEPILRTNNNPNRSTEQPLSFPKQLANSTDGDSTAFNNQNQSLKSYSLVLEQSLTTKDKHIIKELLSTNDQGIIDNSLQGLPESKVGVLLEQIEMLLLEDTKATDNTLAYLQWMKSLLKIHIGAIINSPTIQTTAARLSQFAKKRAGFVDNLQKLRQKIPNSASSQSNAFVYLPKFHYIEENTEKPAEQDKINDQMDDLEFDEGDDFDDL